MSDGPGNPPNPQNPFGGDNDPFKGIPVFGDLARLFSQQGSMSWDAARQLAQSIATNGEAEPNVDPLERIQLEQLSRVAELHVAQVTGLQPSVSGQGLRITPVTRSQWANTTLDAYRPLFEDLANAINRDTAEATPAEPGDWMGQIMAMVGPMMLGMTAGSMVGHLSRRSFGQYDLPIPRTHSDELLVVPANIDEFGTAWSLPGDDLRLWVCLHDVTHHTILNLGHVRTRINDLLHEYLSNFEPDDSSLDERFSQLEIDDPSKMGDLQNLLGDPEILLGAIQSPTQRAMLPRLESLIAAIAGYVDHVMDAIGVELIGSYSMVTEALRRHRVQADPSDRFVERLLGLELTKTQYERGTAFIDGVHQRAGDEGLARLWESDDTLPTPAEVDAPGLWLARIGFIEGPGAAGSDLPADFEIPDDLGDLNL